MTFTWRPMLAEDLPAVSRIGGVVHPSFPESDAVFEERLRLFPQGCRVAEGADGALVGYAVSHPGRLFDPPALDTLLHRLPEEASCLYLHDVALLEAVRGTGLGRAIVVDLSALARMTGSYCLALTAVNNSAAWWQRRGFLRLHPEPPDLGKKLASYGADAAYVSAGAKIPH